MLIPACGFRAAVGPGPPAVALSPKSFAVATELTATIPDFTAPPCLSLRDVATGAMSRSLAWQGNKANLLYFD